GAGWAEAIVALSARRAAVLCRNVKLALDPALIVIGGGIGLAPGYRKRIETHFADVPERLVPRLAAARLGDKAGAVGVADLAGRAAGNQPTNKMGEPK
ncbi:ROK family protein, partial [Nitratireductor sp. ZSWI3]|uniref:ROK family protein n=1 Tax=Nitratireductor sp. ZSWI3 TaxID=2966359 RepID=UPI00214F6F96